MVFIAQWASINNFQFLAYVQLSLFFSLNCVDSKRLWFYKFLVLLNTLSNSISRIKWIAHKGHLNKICQIKQLRFLECILLIFNVFLLHLSWIWTGNFDKTIKMISSVSSRFFWLDLLKDWHLIRKLNSFLNADISPGLIGDMFDFFEVLHTVSLAVP